MANARSSQTSPTPWALPLAVACLIVVLVGFARSYVLPVAQGRFAGAAIFHIHGALFFAWFVLLIVQTVLIRAGRIGLHKALGWVGAALAVGMVVSALAIEISAAQAAIENGRPRQAHVGLLLTVSNAALFALLFIGALGSTPWPQTHRRLVLLAALSIAPIALQRVFFALGLPGIAGIAAAALVADGAALSILIADARRCGRPHPAYVAGLALMLTLQIGRVSLVGTPAWAAFADGLVRLWPL